MKINKALLSSAVAVASSFLVIQAIQTDAEGRGYGIRKSENKQASSSVLPSHEVLRQALMDVVAGADNAGFGLHMWATVVDRDGVVRAVVFSGGDRGDQWPGSRVISAQKANTANAFSLPGLALGTSNLFTAGAARPKSLWSSREQSCQSSRSLQRPGSAFWADQ